MCGCGHTCLSHRFIPDDMTFDDRDPSSVASDADTLSHIPSQFVTSALQQSTVRLTWDETDPRRLSTTMKKYSKEEALDADLRDYLASSSSDSEFEEGNIPKAIGNGNGTDVKVLTEEERLERYKVMQSTVWVSVGSLKTTSLLDHTRPTRSIVPVKMPLKVPFVWRNRLCLLLSRVVYVILLLNVFMMSC